MDEFKEEYDKISEQVFAMNEGAAKWGFFLALLAIRLTDKDGDTTAMLERLEGLYGKAVDKARQETT